ncbi:MULTISPECIES: GtrA family protein [Parabacteroides]|uniref:Flippase GtrA (Transmembrane translocase of bactoprenol-linked glucose) n=1 Tax=Parabacteroides chinchillae TaxID=871327 RepID=A0A8G2BTG5_9BACT|nr:MULTISPECIES: GtrA family protein [Parabacteroides]SEF40440.1 Putative flippase GtrA (transmembrane translocase of bactoprenol-linked glucose) [Parabacteroides chinchillae]
METVKQAIKYGIVGISNTLITMVVIWVMMKLFGCREGLSNITGYIAGILNSFVWNKQWTFKSSSSGWGKSAYRFAVAFVICYLLQYGLVMLLNKHLTIDHYYNHLIGMAFYTVINFIMNKFYTFKS